eukprot:3535749-Rhodomonas_salina.4
MCFNETSPTVDFPGVAQPLHIPETAIISMALFIVAVFVLCAVYLRIAGVPEQQKTRPHDTVVQQREAQSATQALLGNTCSSLEKPRGLWGLNLEFEGSVRERLQLHGDRRPLNKIFGLLIERLRRNV